MSLLLTNQENWQAHLKKSNLSTSPELPIHNFMRAKISLKKNTVCFCSLQLIIVKKDVLLIGIKRLITGKIVVLSETFLRFRFCIDSYSDCNTLNFRGFQCQNFKFTSVYILILAAYQGLSAYRRCFVP